MPRRSKSGPDMSDTFMNGRGAMVYLQKRLETFQKPIDFVQTVHRGLEGNACETSNSGARP